MDERDLDPEFFQAPRLDLGPTQEMIEELDKGLDSVRRRRAEEHDAKLKTAEATAEMVAELRVLREAIDENTEQSIRNTKQAIQNAAEAEARARRRDNRSLLLTGTIAFFAAVKIWIALGAPLP
jgi:vacuolar-type H+-ATPase subunit E/Vma4